MTVQTHPILPFITKFLSKHCIKRVLDTEMNGYLCFNFTEKVHDFQGRSKNSQKKCKTISYTNVFHLSLNIVGTLINSHFLLTEVKFFPPLADNQDKLPAKSPVTTKKWKNTSLSLPKISKGLSALIEDGMLTLIF
jgi:hypothetical protein